MTTLLYYIDPYLKETTATITSVHQESEKRFQITLDQTIFYPRGGGQATDQGSLFTENWEANVYQVLNKQELIIHYIESNVAPVVGMSVQATLNWKRRYLNMRLHSAGHIVDFSLFLLGYNPSPLTPFKADHDKKPVIYYQGTISTDFREDLEQKANELISKNLLFSSEFISLEQMKLRSIYLQPGLPTNKPLRLVTLEEVGSVADGGTLVHHSKEVGTIYIPLIEQKDQTTLIHYRIDV